MGSSKAPRQVELGHRAEGQYQDAPIHHALEYPRDQPERVVVDAVFWICVAELKEPTARTVRLI